MGFVLPAALLLEFLEKNANKKVSIANKSYSPCKLIGRTAKLWHQTLEFLGMDSHVLSNRFLFGKQRLEKTLSHTFVSFLEEVRPVTRQAGFLRAR